MRKLVKVLATLSALALGAVAISACGSDEDAGGQDGGAMTIAATSQPDALDPALSYTFQSWEAVWLVYTPPVTYTHAEADEGTELIPGIAERLPEVSGNGRTYTFTIRDGLEYSDGTPVRASDWEHTIKRVLNLESGGSAFFEVIEGATEYIEGGEAQADISGIQADDQTGEVTINLNDADGTFMNVLAMPFSGIVPGDTPFEDMTQDPPPGVGPYELTESVPNRRYVMERRERFDLPGIEPAKVAKITTEIVNSVNRQTDRVIDGELDYMQAPPPSDRLPEIREQYSDRYSEHETVSTYYFFMNTRVAPFDQQQVREAVNTAIDSTALARLFGGRLTPSCNFLPSNMPGYEESDPCPFGSPDGPGDIDAAREMVSDAGEDGTQVEVFTNGDENRPAIGQYYADLLNQIGLDAELRTLDGGVYFETIGNARTRAATGFTNWFQDFPHPANFLFLVDGTAIQPTNNQNIGNVDDPQLNRLIDRINVGAASDPQVQEAAAEADRLLIEKAYIAPYGSEDAGVFLSERMDPECKRYHPVYGTDYTAFCLAE
jgi:peptide/nickel transport system substrate-binding protein